MSIAGFLIVFDLIFGVILYDFIEKLGFKYIDELVALWLIVWLLYGVLVKKIPFYKDYTFIIFVYVAYLVYSLLLHVNIVVAVVSDFVVIFKSMAVFLAVSTLGFDLNRKDRQVLSMLLFFLFFFLLSLGLSGVGIKSVFTHPSRFATACVVCAFLLFYINKVTIRSIVFFVVYLSLGLFSLRSKMYGFFTFSLFFLILNYRSIILNYFKLERKHLFMTFCLVIPVLFFTWDKLYFYFIYGVRDFSHIFARPALYLGSLQIAFDYFPFGTGFASYASYFSAIYYSPIYDDYGLSNVHGLSYISPGFIADSFFPCILGQFGFFGLLLFFLFWFRILRESQFAEVKVLPLLIFIFFMIESVADSTFTHNRGMFVMIILGLCLNRRVRVIR